MPERAHNRPGNGMTRVGAVVSPYHHPPESLREAVQTAEAARVPELWLWEDCFRESAFASVAAALAWTDRLHLGLGIAPIPLRNVAATAMEIATIERMFPGRFSPGVGHGVLPWMAQVGARAASPLSLMREYLPPLRALLAGDEVTARGEHVRLDRVRLDWPPASAPPVYASAEGPKTLAVTGELADGTILNWGYTSDEVAAQVARVREARAATDRDGEATIVAYVSTAFGDGARGRVADAFSDRADPEARGVWGDPGDVATGLRRFVDAGVDAVVLVPTPGDDDLVPFLHAAGEVARHLE